MQDSGFFPRAGRVRHLESQNQSPYTGSPKHEHPLLIRTDPIKMPKALRAEINVGCLQSSKSAAIAASCPFLNSWGAREVRRWHARQWHREMRDGSPSIVRWSCPQLVSGDCSAPWSWIWGREAMR